MVKDWEARSAGETSDADRRLQTARDLIAIRGFQYLDAGRVAQLPFEGIMARSKAIPTKDGIPDRVEAATLFGGVSGADKRFR